MRLRICFLEDRLNIEQPFYPQENTTGLWMKLLLILSLLLLACKKQPIETSETKWGILGEAAPENDYNKFLINIPPHSKIAICGRFMSGVNHAFKEWATHLNRLQYITISLYRDCSKINEADYHTIIESYQMDSTPLPLLSQRNLEVAREGCSRTDEEGGIAMFAAFSTHNKPRHIIAACRYDKVTEHGTMHEMGHAWGLCDQYRIDNGKVINHLHHDNCSDLLRSEHNYEGVMAADPPVKQGREVTNPTDDEDVVGIRVLACIDSKTAREWTAVNSSYMKNWWRTSQEIAKINSISNKYRFLDACKNTSQPDSPPSVQE